MKTFNKMAAQGDVVLMKIEAIPPNAIPAQPNENSFVVAHSETGHDHVIDRTKVEMYTSADDEFIAWIRVLERDVELEHKRPFDTHESLLLKANTTYQVRRQREYVPEGYRRAAD